MELLKETFDAWLQRVKSPVIGYIILAGLILNWKPIWFLIFADRSVYEKFAYFDIKTSSDTLFLYPVLIGVVSAVVVPWIGFAGAFLVGRPARLLRQLQQDARTDHEIYRLQKQTSVENAKAQEEAVREERQLEQAKRLKVAEEIGPEVRDELELSRESIEDHEEMPLDGISAIDRILIEFLGQSSDPIRVKEIPESPASLTKYKTIVRDGNKQRMTVDLLASDGSLKRRSLVSHDSFGRTSLTTKGYALYDSFPK